MRYGRTSFRYMILVIAAVLVVSWGGWMSGCSVKQKTDMSKYSKYKYIASRNSMKFHTRSCFLGKRIALEDAAFFNSASLARRAGYKPCPICQP